ncbi:MAG: hypothetical protein L3J41_11535 [Melioribacteraceae bacterium]|nr:hypothetical protein [Melioribacteraceae bacterium]
MFIKFRIILTLKIFVILFVSSNLVFSQDTDAPVKGKKSLLKTMGFADEAVGVQTKGQLQNLIMNYGQITDTRYEDRGNAPTDLFFDFRYPRENFTGVSDDFSIFFAIKENSKNGDKGNVIDAWTDNDNEDFIAKDGSYGNTHYNPSNDPSPHTPLLYNGQTPYLAHSDLPDTWPVDENGVSFWPGIFRRDPITGKEIEGEFSSDRDIYIEFNDNNNQQGDVLGIEVNQMAYSYGRVYADNILFFESWIINKGDKDLTNCYMGYYQDPDCSDHGEEILLIKDSTFADGSRLLSIAQRDFDGDIGGATRPNSKGVTEDYTFGTVFLETPNNMGITDFHYFVDTGPTNDEILWPIITSDKTNPSLAGTADRYFHGSNVRFDDVSTIKEKADLVWIAATGPFDLAKGDTIKSMVAVVIGDDDADYYKNVWQAKELFDALLNGPVAPSSPNLSGVADDGKITLYWDNKPELERDPSSGEMDFEGYKIYRSEDGGVTWGTKITDVRGRTYGYVPIAQFDLENNIKGIDPKNSLIWLGEDSGLQYKWVDENVINGIEYSYTIVSYDRGTPTLFSLEGTRGDSPDVPYFVNITPSPKALDIVPAELKEITHTKGTGEGKINIDVVDDSELTEYNYKLTFEETLATRFSVTRMDNENNEIFTSKLISDGVTTVSDGFSISIETDNQLGGLKSIADVDGNSVEGSNNVQDSSWYVAANLFPQADTLSKTASYSIQFGDDKSFAYSWGIGPTSVAIFETPFSVLDLTNNRKVCFEVQDANKNSQWDKGEIIFITRVPYPEPAPAIGSQNPATVVAEFAYQVVINNAPNGNLDTPPSSGTIINVNSYNPFTKLDEYLFSFKPTSNNSDNIDLSKIKVVPNPYIVTSLYESQQNVREIRFMYLPSECKIYIYTMSGTLVKTLYHNNNSGSMGWNLLSEWNQALAFGIYFYVVEDPQGNKTTNKFALIK